MRHKMPYSSVYNNNIVVGIIMTTIKSMLYIMSLLTVALLALVVGYLATNIVINAPGLSAIVALTSCFVIMLKVEGILCNARVFFTKKGGKNLKRLVAILILIGIVLLMLNSNQETGTGTGMFSAMAVTGSKKGDDMSLKKKLTSLGNKFKALIDGTAEKVYTAAVKCGGRVVSVDIKSKEIKVVSKDAVRYVSWKGQSSRALALVAYVVRGMKGMAKRAAMSIINWRESVISIQTYIFTPDNDTRDKNKNDRNDRLEVGPVVETYRRDGLWNRFSGLEIVQVIDGRKVVGDSRIQIEKAAKDGTLLDEKIGKGYGFGFGYIYEKSRREILREYKAKGLVFLGGNAQSGIMLFGNDTFGIDRKDYDNLLRWSKILLRGGIQLASDFQFTAKLVEFPEDPELPGYRDGIFMILSRTVAKALAKASLVWWSGVCQATFYNGESAMKGLITEALTQELLKLRGDEQAVISLSEYNKIFGASKKEGDYVTISGSDIWLMSDNTGSMQKDVHVSGQAVRRAPKGISKFLNDKNMEMRNGVLDITASGDGLRLAKMLPSWGVFKKIKTAGLRPFKQRLDDGSFGPSNYLDRKIQEDLVRANKKGYKLPGAGGFLVHNSKLPVYTPGSGVPGITVGKSTGLKVGDFVLFIRYPILDAKDNLGNSGGIFICQVVGITDVNFIGMNPLVVRWAMGDEDGDQPNLIFLSKDDVETYGLLNHPVGQVEVSAAIKGSGKVGYKNLLSAYASTGGNVGVVSNRVEAVKLYLQDEGVDLSTVKTPTGDELSFYLGCCEQCPITSMKHEVNKEYAWAAFDEWSKDLIPWAIEVDDNGRQKWIKHPELKAQKPTLDVDKPTLPDVANHLDYKGGGLWSTFMKKALEYRLNSNAFVDWDYYDEHIRDFINLLKEFIVDQDTRNALNKKLQNFRKGYFALVYGKDEETADAYFEYKRLTLKLSMKPAEWLYLQALMMGESVNIYEAGKPDAKQHNPYTWIKFCDLETVQAFAEFAEDDGIFGDVDVIKLVGLNGRNKITATKSYSSIDLDAGVKRIRVWSKTPVTLKPLLGKEIEVKGNKILSLPDVFISGKFEDGAYTVDLAQYYEKADGSTSNKSAWLTLV